MSERLSLVQRVRLARLGGLVERCHIIPHVGSYSTAAHSWGVAMLMLQLFPHDFGRLAQYCICHDVPEAWTGDVPAHTKARSVYIRKALKEMEDEVFLRLELPPESELAVGDAMKLKICDSLELYIWAQDEVRAGNKHALEIVEKLEGWYNSGIITMPAPARELYNALQASENDYDACLDKPLVMKDY